MLEIILEKNLFYYGMAILFTVGVVLKIFASRKLKKLNAEAREMNKSSDPFLKLVKAKFEHASMANDRVENVDVFVDKYLREYKICGLSMYGIQKCKISLVIGVSLLALLGGAGQYMVTLSTSRASVYWVTGIVASLILVGFYQMTDEKYRLTTVRIYMIDYLENVMANRINRANNTNRVNRVREEVLLEEPVAVMESTEDAYPLVKEELPQEVQYQDTTTGTNLSQVEEVQESQVKKLEMANLLKIKLEENEEELKRQHEAKNESNKPFNILDAMAKRDVVEDTPNEALIREILQEFMA